MRSLYMTFRFSSKQNSIGFIGVGNMGSGMIQNIAKHFKVLAYDTNANFMQLLKNQHNITRVDSLNQLAVQANIFIMMLPSDKISKQVCEETLFVLAQKNSLIIDCSTISPYTALELNKNSQKHNMTYVDSPVSGGIGAAAAGGLTFMVGAQNDQIFEQCSTYLKHMGKNIFNCESPGSGQVSKICNNMALGIEMVAVSEALNLGQKMGVDPKLLTKIMSVSSSRCWSVDTYNPVPGVNPDVPASKNYDGGFATELMLKDLTIATNVANQSGSKTPLGNLTKQIYSNMNGKGLGRKDFSVVFQQLNTNQID